MLMDVQPLPLLQQHKSTGHLVTSNNIPSTHAHPSSSPSAAILLVPLPPRLNCPELRHAPAPVSRNLCPIAPFANPS